MSALPDTWCETLSGRRWEILAPSPADVHWPDIAGQLARQCRFNGATRFPWSVASHSCFVADILAGPLERPDLAAYGLLHDAHETYLGDLVRPVQRALGRAMPAFKALWHDLCDRQDVAIFAAARLRWPLGMVDATALDLADRIALSTERAQLMAPRDDWEALPHALDFPLRPESEEAARANFLTSLRALGIVGGAA